MSGIRVLLLNQSYLPIQGISLRKAMKHLSKGKVEVIHYDENSAIYSTRNSWKIPTVVRLISSDYVRLHAYEPKCTKAGIHVRDNYTCAYCSEKISHKQLTIDHIVPVSKGGLTTWSNCVTACKKCNSHKADFSIEETKMYLRIKPYVPKSAIVYNEKNYKYRDHPHWLKFLSYLK